MLDRYRAIRLARIGAALLIAAAFTAQASAEETAISGFVENATYARDGRGLTKSRTTGQIEAHRGFGRLGLFRDVAISGTLRSTYNAVYDANAGQFGRNAGGPILLENGTDPRVPHGGGAVLPGGDFDTTLNPNRGLKVLGRPLHGTNGGVAFGVPQRPCNRDSRGCIGGYLNYDKDDLRFPDWNDRVDWLRELFVDSTVQIGSTGQEVDFRLGRQQVVWGRTDLFRVLDVVNPVDFSRHNIYDELEDIRYPMWILNSEYRVGATRIFQDLNFSVMWNFDKFRPNNLGQGGTPYAILDTGSFFRGMNNCWDNGCTVANLADVDMDGDFDAVDFAPGVIGIRKARTPGWSFKNTQIGGKVEGVYKGVGFSLNALYYRSQFPSLRGGIPADNPFTPAVESETFDHLIAFDIHFPRILLIGGSADIYADPIQSVFRVEVANSHGEEFANTIKPRLFSTSDVMRWVVGWDRPTFFRPLNRTRAFLLSAQLFGQHILDHQRDSRPLGKAGIPDRQHNFTATFLVQGGYFNDRVIPELILAHDFRAEATVWGPSVDWLVNDNWRVNLAASIKSGHGARKFDDCRSCDPFDVAPPPGSTASAGLGGFEPLGRFRSGPIGMAQKEDEIQLTLRYRF